MEIILRYFILGDAKSIIGPRERANIGDDGDEGKRKIDFYTGHKKVCIEIAIRVRRKKGVFSTIFAN